MASGTPDLLEIQQADASSVIVHQVPEGLTESFLQWQRGITATAQQFPGYARTEVYPPIDGGQKQWVIVVHFENEEELQRWLDSPERAQWLARLVAESSKFSTRILRHGFGPWFADLDSSGAAPTAPAGWKMALVVVLALYPTVMLLTLLVMPRLTGLGLAWSMLISNALSVSILQWGLMPLLTRGLRRWLSPSAGATAALSIAGTLGIAALIASLATLFRCWAG